MRNLSIFDEDFNLIREPEEDNTFDLALEISNRLKGKTKKLSHDATELLEAEQGRIRGSFIKLMLFADAQIETIAACMDMKEELVVAYKEIFFDTSLIRGQLGKTEMYEDMLYKYDDGTQQFNFATMLRDAHLGGPDIVMAQFNIELDAYGVASYKDREQKYMMWQLKDTDRGSRDYITLNDQMRARKAVLTTIKEAAATNGHHKMSDLASLVRIIETMSEESMGVGEIEVRSYDIETDTVMEADLLPAPTEGSTDE